MVSVGIRVGLWSALFEAQADKSPTMRSPMRRAAILKKLVLPLQLKFSNRNCVPFLYASLAQCYVHSKGFHDLLEAADRAIVLPVGHRSRALDRHARYTPFILPLARNVELTWVLFWPVNGQRQLHFFQWRCLFKFLIG